MPTFLFNDIIFGPVKSRRLGVSLGINLLPDDYKYCNYDCLYCECGWTLNQANKKLQLPRKEEVKMALREKLMSMQQDGMQPDAITFAGNGEPTIHPDFDSIIDDTIQLRDEFCPGAKISVLSNATMIHRENIRAALKRVDNNILKFDAATDQLYRFINRSKSNLSVEDLAKRLMLFDGNLKIQTMFVKGVFEGVGFDNSTDEHVHLWLSFLGRIAPKQVMIYPLDRDTPAEGLLKISRDRMDEIAKMVTESGFDVQVNY